MSDTTSALMALNVLLNEGHAEIYTGAAPRDADGPITGALLGYHELGFSPINRTSDGDGVIKGLPHTGDSYTGPWYARLYGKGGAMVLQGAGSGPLIKGDYVEILIDMKKG